MPNFFGQILRFVLKLVLAVFAAIFAVSLLAAALVFVVFSLLTSLVTGRKPAPAVVFGRFQRFSPQGMWPGAPRPNVPTSAAAGQIVDVEVREIPSDKPLP